MHVKFSRAIPVSEAAVWQGVAYADLYKFVMAEEEAVACYDCVARGYRKGAGEEFPRL